MCYVAVAVADEAVLAAKFAVMRPFLDERAWRVYLGTEADALGFGGIAAVARASGASETTVAAGLAEARDPAARAVLAPGRSRRPGAGRPKAEDRQPGLTQTLDGLLEEGRRGDPVSAVTWNILSLRDISRQMRLRGFTCSKDVIARLMHAGGYSLQGMSRVLEGRQHEDRDLQFGNINADIARALDEGEPVISVDGKKKEPLGAYGRAGRTWQPGGEPVKVRSHDFKDKDTVTICPYGIYDIAANRGFVSVGISCDTAAFAVNAIRRWWQQEGQSRYPRATRLLVTCDAGGANDWRSQLWKDQLALLAGQTRLRIEVMHFPPGTSKWNKIEHRLFCHITRTWRARPLMTVADAVAGIAATVTGQGLKCTAVIDDGDYPKGLKVPPARVKELEERHLDRDRFHGEWNYALLPVPRPAPDPAPEPGPGPAGPDPALVTGLAALAGIDLPALTAALALPWQAAREQQLHLARGGARTRRPGNHGRTALTLDTLITATACHHQLGMTWQLLGSLLSLDHSTLSRPAARLTPLLEPHGITRTRPRSRISTPAQLHEHAAARSITIPGTTQQATANQTSHDTPETTN
jgi:Rhodopirellula transposase DDE domain